MSSSPIRIAALTGKPVQVEGTQVSVCSRLVQLRLPFVNGGLIWHRPVAVQVQSSTLRDETLPVPDVTRTVILMLLGLSLAWTCLLRFLRRKVG